MYTTDGILHTINWYALTIAATVPGTYSAEAAFRTYYDGTGKQSGGREKYEFLRDMRKASVPWKDIAEMMECGSVANAQSIYTHGKKRYGK